MRTWRSARCGTRSRPWNVNCATHVRFFPMTERSTGHCCSDSTPGAVRDGPAPATKYSRATPRGQISSQAARPSTDRPLDPTPGAASGARESRLVLPPRPRRTTRTRHQGRRGRGVADPQGRRNRPGAPARLDNQVGGWPTRTMRPDVAVPAPSATGFRWCLRADVRSGRVWSSRSAVISRCGRPGSLHGRRGRCVRLRGRGRVGRGRARRGRLRG